MVLFNRLENYAKQNRLFSNLQFGFQEGVGCTEASFAILEKINHMLERGSKAFGCFIDVVKRFDTVWMNGLLYKLFSEFNIRGRVWLVIKDLYTEVRGQVLYSSTLSRKFDISQGTGQGRILAPFMYKVYLNSLLNELTSHCYTVSINRLTLPSPSFADDIALYSTSLKSPRRMCYAGISFIQSHSSGQTPGTRLEGSKNSPPGNNHCVQKPSPRDKTGSQKPHP